MHTGRQGGRLGCIQASRGEARMQAGMHTGWQGGRLGCRWGYNAYRLAGREARMQAGMQCIQAGRDAGVDAMHTGWQGNPLGGGWASITGGLVGQRTAPPLLLLLLSFNNCFSMSNFVLATKRYLI